MKIHVNGDPVELPEGTTLAATTDPRPKKAPWLRLVIIRDSSSVV